MSTKRQYLYLCNGEAECSTSGRCYKNLGNCKHTSKIEFAKNKKLNKFQQISKKIYLEIEEAKGNAIL